MYVGVFDFALCVRVVYSVHVWINAHTTCMCMYIMAIIMKTLHICLSGSECMIWRLHSLFGGKHDETNVGTRLNPLHHLPILLLEVEDGL